MLGMSCISPVTAITSLCMFCSRLHRDLIPSCRSCEADSSSSQVKRDTKHHWQVGREHLLEHYVPLVFLSFCTHVLHSYVTQLMQKAGGSLTPFANYFQSFSWPENSDNCGYASPKIWRLMSWITLWSTLPFKWVKWLEVQSGVRLPCIQDIYTKFNIFYLTVSFQHISRYIAFTVGKILVLSPVHFTLWCLDVLLFFISQGASSLISN